LFTGENTRTQQTREVNITVTNLTVTKCHKLTVNWKHSS